MSQVVPDQPSSQSSDEPSDQPELAGQAQDVQAGGIEDTDDATSTDDSRAVSAEEFAREHDPADHDIAAGKEARQKGDWTADEEGGPQVWDADGHLVNDESDTKGAGSQDADSPRISSLEEVHDGGYGVGSAAVIEDGAVPLGHQVKAWEDTKSFRTPEQSGYDDAEPHLWFADGEAARNAGFQQVE